MGDKRAHAEAWGPAWSSWEWGPSAQRGGAGTAGGLRCRERWGNVNNTEWGGGQSVVKPVSGELVKEGQEPVFKISSVTFMKKKFITEPQFT